MDVDEKGQTRTEKNGQKISSEKGSQTQKMSKKGAELLKAKVKLLPHRPGVYRMISEAGKVLYVGKAKDLKKRVTSYTLTDKLSVRIQRMVAQTADLIVVETDNEAEAFLLENELIKRYYPHYNILLKDDKSFPYLFFSNADFPRISKYRGSRKEKGNYYGPYASGREISEALEILQKVFLLRNCTDVFFKNRTRPCLQYQIKRCSAPCVGKITQEEYAKSVTQAKEFIQGKDTRIQKELINQMNDKSKHQQYEEALVLRDRIAALNQLRTGLDGSLDKTLDADFIAVYKDGIHAAIQIFFFRHGQNGGTHAMFFDDVAEQSPSDILESFIGQFYQEITPPREVILNHSLADRMSIEEAFSSTKGSIVEIKTSLRGGRKKIMERAEVNAKQALERHLLEKGIQAEQLQALADLLGIPKISKVEVYDNSHIQGTSSVGAMIAAGEEGFMKNSYRRFNIEQAQTNDDFGMMKEVLTRRLKREDPLPDLIIIDGGKGQLSAAEGIMKASGHDVPLLAVAKGPERNAGNEKLFITNNKNPILLPHTSPLLFFIQRLRDEAHRFAVGSHRIKRNKESNRKLLDEIEGIGAARRKKLLQHFGTPKAVFEASLAQLSKVDGISENIAKKIYTFTHKGV